MTPSIWRFLNLMIWLLLLMFLVTCFCFIYFIDWFPSINILKMPMYFSLFCWIINVTGLQAINVNVKTKLELLNTSVLRLNFLLLLTFIPPVHNTIRGLFTSPNSYHFLRQKHKRYAQMKLWNTGHDLVPRWHNLSYRAKRCEDVLATTSTFRIGIGLIFSAAHYANARNAVFPLSTREFLGANCCAQPWRPRSRHCNLRVQLHEGVSSVAPFV